ACCEALVGKSLHSTHAIDVADEEAGESGHRARDRLTGALEQLLAGGQRGANVAPPPRVGELVAGNFRATADELLDLGDTDAVLAGPGCDLVDLRGELLGIFADDLDKGAARLRVDSNSTIRELASDPFGEPPLLDVVHENLAGFRARLSECRVLLCLLADESEDRVGRRFCEVGDDGLRVRDLPAVDVRDDDEPLTAAEEPHRVAGSNSVLSARVEGGQE